MLCVILSASEDGLPHWAQMIFCLTIIGTCWCCFFRGNYESDHTDRTFKDIVSTPKPRAGTVYYEGSLIKAILFPTFDGRWNATIVESDTARDKSIIGLNLENYDKNNVYLRSKEDFFLGFTKREWFVHGPHMCLMILPIVFGFIESCPGLPEAELWVPLFCILNWVSNIMAFCFRLHQNEKSKIKPIFGLMKLTQIGLAFWGITLFWPKAKAGWTEELDCGGPMFFIGFMMCTIYSCLVTLIAIVVLRQRFKNRRRGHDFGYDEDDVDKSPVKQMEIKDTPCDRCRTKCPCWLRWPCCKKHALADLEMSVSQNAAGAEL